MVAAPKGPGGQGSAASPVPCRAGKLREENFSGPSPRRKTASVHRLGHDPQQQSQAWQGTGREARKTLVLRFGIARSLPAYQFINWQIRTVLLCGAELRCGNRAALSPAPREAKRTAGVPSPRTRAMTRSAAASRRCAVLQEKGLSGNPRRPRREAGITVRHRLMGEGQVIAKATKQSRRSGA